MPQQLVLNATQHTLTDAQRAAFGTHTTIVELKNVNPTLFASLSACPSDSTALRTLADTFLDFVSDPDHHFAIVHLPLGSPAFQLILGQKIAHYPTPARPLFYLSHSARQVTLLPDGSKQVTFNFQGFTIL